MNILDIVLPENDAGAETILEYCVALATEVLEQGESFRGKRPFGNSGWEWELHYALEKHGIETSSLSESLDLIAQAFRSKVLLGKINGLAETSTT